MTAGPAVGSQHVAVVGGGLAGLAAAVALSSAGCRVEIFEARSYLGGRAASFRDPVSGERVDLCQHVSMGCCTNLADFCRRTGIDAAFRRERSLHFIGPRGEHCRLEASRWLPAPLHLLPALMRLSYLSLAERLRIATALARLARISPEQAETISAQGWFVAAGQSPRSLEQFWGLVLVSALGETLDRVSLAAARKVFVDGFMAHRHAYELEVPQAPLTTIYDEQLRLWLAEHQIGLRLGSPIEQIEVAADGRFTLEDGRNLSDRFDALVVAVPWRQASEIFGATLRDRLDWLPGLNKLEPSPITGVHLWFDRPIMDLPHAVLVGRLSQWVFARGQRPAADQVPGDEPARAWQYYQVVVSASGHLAAGGRDSVIAEVCCDLAEVFPAARDALLRHARVVTETAAVFSPLPCSQRLRPPQRTLVAGLAVAGDWTDTGWPATMEGAVRSGYLAAEALLAQGGQPTQCLVDDLPRALLLRWWAR